MFFLLALICKTYVSCFSAFMNVNGFKNGDVVHHPDQPDSNNSSLSQTSLDKVSVRQYVC